MVYLLWPDSLTSDLHKKDIDSINLVYFSDLRNYFTVELQPVHISIVAERMLPGACGILKANMTEPNKINNTTAWSSYVSPQGVETNKVFHIKSTLRKVYRLKTHFIQL